MIPNKFPPPAKFLLYSVLALLVVGVAGYVYVRNANYHSALETTKEWAQLNDFPLSATNLKVSTQGNMFTREFCVKFNAPLEDIETWLNESPGTKSITPTRDGSVRRYEIEPGGGAAHAFLELDENTGHVRINTWWS